MTKKNDAEQNALIREVWDGVREQKVADFLKAYWKHIAAGFALFLVMIVGIQWYRASRVSAQLEEAALFERVLSRSALNETERDSLLQTLVSTGTHGYQGIGVLMQADKAMKQGQTAKAVTLLEEGKDKVEIKELRHLIILKLALLRSDEMAYSDLKELISPLLDKGEAFYATSTLLLGFKAMDEKKTEEATAHFDALIQDKTVPFTIRSTAQEMKNAL